MNLFLLFILFLNLLICSNVEVKNEEEIFEEPTESDFERELEEDRLFIIKMDLQIKENCEMSKRIRESVSQTFRELDELLKEINNR